MIFRFKHWSSDFVINSQGTHIVHFEKDFPLTFGCFRFSYDRPVVPNYHEYFEISFVHKGTGTFRIGNRLYDLHPGDLIVLGNTEMHNLLSDNHNPIDMVSIYFLPELVARPGSTDLDFELLSFFYNFGSAHGNYIEAGSIDSAGLSTHLETAYSAFISREPHYKLRIRNELYDILLILLKHFEQNLVPEKEQYDKRLNDVRRLHPVFRLIENNYNSSISLEEASLAANMSRHYFCRFFKKTTGSTFIQYIHQVRIDRAKQLMLTSNLSITQIALEVGFESVSHFFRVFHRLTLLTPLKYLKNIESGRILRD